MEGHGKMDEMKRNLGARRSRQVINNQMSLLLQLRFGVSAKCPVKHLYSDRTIYTRTYMRHREVVKHKKSHQTAWDSLCLLSLATLNGYIGCCARVFEIGVTLFTRDEICARGA